MDHIDDKLSSDATGSQYPAAIRAALMMGKRTLYRYYDITGRSEVYRIAMGTVYFIPIFLLLIEPVLHPRHKLSYFKNSGRSDVFVQTARHVVRNEYNRSYKIRNISEGVTDGDESDEEQVCTVCCLLLVYYLYCCPSIAREN